MRYTTENLMKMEYDDLKRLFDYIVYKGFRTGQNFNSVRQQLKREQTALYHKGIYKFVTRHTVLGKLREIKLSMYESEIQSHEPFTKQEMTDMILQSRWWIKKQPETIQYDDLPI